MPTPHELRRIAESEKTELVSVLKEMVEQLRVVNKSSDAFYSDQIEDLLTKNKEIIEKHLPR